MLALNTENISHSFLNFAALANNLLNIDNNTDYKQALAVVEDLFSQVEDRVNDPLNALIEMIAKAIKNYENSIPKIREFEKKAKQLNSDVSTLKVLIQQHQLNIADFKEEIGSKPLVSMILNGKRNLTKKHIAKLSKRFNISPALFYSN